MHVAVTPRRRVQPGDKIWLVYSDSERARYIREHGHGKLWRHRFTVLKVKPHAVLLDIPKDGSVPEVLPWQSLRKCAFAAPHLHHPALLLPDVNERGRPMMPQDDMQSDDALPTTQGDDSDEMGWAAWAADPQQQFEIERIVSASRSGSGWQLNVKWKGYPDTTPEPLSKILKQTEHPDIIADIERCKNDYLAQHPAERTMIDVEDKVVAAALTRVQPARERKQTTRLAYFVYNARDSPTTAASCMHAINVMISRTHARTRACQQCLPDFGGRSAAHPSTCSSRQARWAEGVM